jgi:hypothetical protein
VLVDGIASGGSSQCLTGTEWPIVAYVAARLGREYLWKRDGAIVREEICKIDLMLWMRGC